MGNLKNNQKRAKRGEVQIRVMEYILLNHAGLRRTESADQDRPPNIYQIRKNLNLALGSVQRAVESLIKKQCIKIDKNRLTKKDRPQTPYAPTFFGLLFYLSQYHNKPITDKQTREKRRVCESSSFFWNDEETVNELTKLLEIEGEKMNFPIFSEIKVMRKCMEDQDGYGKGSVFLNIFLASDRVMGDGLYLGFIQNPTWYPSGYEAGVEERLRRLFAEELFRYLSLRGIRIPSERLHQIANELLENKKQELKYLERALQLTS